MKAATTLAALVLLGPATSEAHAYIDPGTGGSLFSSLGLMLGVFVAFAAMMLTQIKRCGQWFVAKLYFRREKELVDRAPTELEHLHS
jgi:hypothetical protein